MLTFGELLKHVITLRGQILVSCVVLSCVLCLVCCGVLLWCCGGVVCHAEPLTPVCPVQNVHVCTGTTRTCFLYMCAWCRYTGGHFERDTREVFQRGTPHRHSTTTTQDNTQNTTHKTTHNTQDTTHKTQHTTTYHNNTRRQKDNTRDKTRRETRDKVEDERQDKTRDKTR